MKQIAIYGFSANPATTAHRKMIQYLSDRFDQVIVIPCGPRPDKSWTNDTSTIDRAFMTSLITRGLPKVTVDLFDLENQTFTPHQQLFERYKLKGELWFAVGDEYVIADNGVPMMLSDWEGGTQIWQQLNWLILSYHHLKTQNLPPHHRVIQPDPATIPIRSTVVRHQVMDHRPITDLVTPEVERYINYRRLYRGTGPANSASISRNEIKPFLFVDQMNDQALRIAEQYQGVTLDEANAILVIGGDGTMLRAIQAHWQAYLPFIGLNKGTYGFLLNDVVPADLTGQTNWQLMQFPLLYVESVGCNGEKRIGYAFNDVVIERAQGQVASLSLSINGSEVEKNFRGDGLLIATPAGSTGYAYSITRGNSIMTLDNKALLLVRNNSLNIALPRSVNLPDTAQFDILANQVEKRPVRVFVDGNLHQEPICELKVRISRIAAVEVLFNDSHNYHQKVTELQFGKSS